MSSSDEKGSGVSFSGNVNNNQGANNNGIGAGNQNFGKGAGAIHANSYGPYGGNMNIGPGAGGLNAGTAAGSINRFNAPVNISSKNKTAEKSVRRGTESASIETENSHGAKKDEAKAATATSDLAVRLLENLDKINKNRDVSLARFSMVPTMLQRKADHLLDIFPNLTTRSKANTVMIEDTLLKLCATMQYMEVTPFAKMNEDFFYLCRDAIDDADSINFEVRPIRELLLNLAKAYLGMVKLGMARHDMVGNLDEQIEDQGKHVEEMEKSSAKMKELVPKLEEGLMLVKACLESLNQEKERLSSMI